MTVTASLIPVTSVPSLLTIEVLVTRSHLFALLAALFAIWLFPWPVVAAEIQTLAPVIVVGTLKVPPAPAPAPALDQAIIRQLPAGNASLSELLRLLPGLQLSEEYNSAKSGGEILPPTISILRGEGLSK